MSEYLLSVHMMEGDLEPDAATMAKAYADVDAFNAELHASGAWVFAGGLQPADSATVVDATGAEVVTTDGPFAETRSTSAASGSSTWPTWTRRWPGLAKVSAACRAPVEMWPFQDEPCCIPPIPQPTGPITDDQPLAAVNAVHTDAPTAGLTGLGPGGHSLRPPWPWHRPPWSPSTARWPWRSCTDRAVGWG